MNTVMLDKRDGYAIVTLNRPDQMNALSRELRADFVAAFQDLCSDKAMRVVILTGVGKAFCAGFDLKELGASTEENSAEEVGNALPRMIGMSRAKEISFTGTPVFAQQALAWGLVNHMVPAAELMPRAIRMAEEMCA